MINYIIKSFKRKIARRIHKKYPHKVSGFNLPGLGEILFANWQNPLTRQKVLTASSVNFFKKFIPPGSLCIDIGANVGEHAVSMALANGKDGLVLAFDPNPMVFEILKVNASLNKDLTNIEPFNFAITEQEGEFYYSSDEASFDNGGISANPDNYHGPYKLPQKIRGIKLEEFLEKNFAARLPKLSLIKIDTEGYDKEILGSISALIEKYHPIIIAECFKKLSQADRYELYDTVEKHGYELFYFQSFDESTTTAKLNRDDMMIRKHFDFYAKPVTTNNR